MHLIKGELTEELQNRYQIRENEIARILWNIEEAFTEDEILRPGAQAIIKWLELRDLYQADLGSTLANP